MPLFVLHSGNYFEICVLQCSRSLIKNTNTLTQQSINIHGGIKSMPLIGIELLLKVAAAIAELFTFIMMVMIHWSFRWKSFFGHEHYWFEVQLNWSPAKFEEFSFIGAVIIIMFSNNWLYQWIIQASNEYMLFYDHVTITTTLSVEHPMENPNIELLSALSPKLKPFVWLHFLLKYKKWQTKITHQQEHCCCRQLCISCRGVTLDILYSLTWEKSIESSGREIEQENVDKIE